MNQVTVQTQINAIRQATEKALKSKESALKFLVDAGIVKDENRHTSQKNEKK